jgi:hypothetical protein
MRVKLDDNFSFTQDGHKYNLCDLPEGFTIKGDVYLSHKDVGKLPDLSKVFVEGNFACRGALLYTLKGAPKKVSGNFDCGFNELGSLEGAPQEVGGDFNCSGNDLESLEGAPKKVSGDFDCSENSGLISLCQVTPDCNIIHCDEKLAQQYGLKGSDIAYKELKESPVFQKEKEQQEKIESQKGHLQERQEYLAERKGEKVLSPTEPTTHDSTSSAPSKPNGRDDGGR